MLPVLVGGARFALGGLGFAQLTLGAGPVADGQLLIVQLQAGHVEAARAAVAQQHWRPLQVVCLRRRVHTRQSASQKTWLVGELLFHSSIISGPKCAMQHSCCTHALQDTQWYSCVHACVSSASKCRLEGMRTQGYEQHWKR